MSPLETLDAHASPPRPLRDLYKYYQRLSLQDLQQDDFVIDLARGITPRQHKVLFRVPQVSTVTKIEAVAAFSRADLAVGSCPCPSSSEDIVDQHAYGIRPLPGLTIIPRFLPPNSQLDLLSRLLHRDLSDSRHKTNIHLHHHVSYPQRTQSSVISDVPHEEVERGYRGNASFFAVPPSAPFQLQPKWPTVHRPLNTRQMLEKKLRWMTLGGQYDWATKRYPSERPPAFPRDIATLLMVLFPQIRPEAAIVNLYSPGDTLSLHRDVSEQSEQDLVSVSLGCDGVFIVGSCDSNDEDDSTDHLVQSVAIRLHSGDAVVMSGAARFAWHGVPKVLPSTCPSWMQDWPAADGEGGSRTGSQYSEWKGWMASKRINLNWGVEVTPPPPARLIDHARWSVSAKTSINPLGPIPRIARRLVLSMDDWQAIAAKKRESIFSSFPSQWRLPGPVVSAHDQRDVSGSYLHQYLSPREIEITETDALAILERTTTGKWKSRDVVEAFCHRAALAHQLTNCLHEVFFDQALNNAEALDRHFAEHGRPVGPLHGLPVSLKDQFHVKDVETTMGYIGWIGTFQGLRGTGRERVFESELVKELRSMGAVLYCKTSVPHTLMSGETVNNIIGYTWNPKNRRLSSGGSSGGEGALLGLRGSPLGFGTDIGGSIRIPAAFNGLFGLRPSSGRLPYEGMANSMDGQNSLLSVVGPLSHSVPALRLVVRSILDQKPWFSDPMVHEIPWRVDEENRMLELIHGRSLGEPRLAFAVLRHDGIVQPQPPVRRAVGLAVRALERLGHTVFEWDPPSHRTSNDLTGAIWLLDGGNDAHASLRLSGEPISRQVAGAFGQEPKQEASASKIAVTNVAKRQWQKQYMDYWNSTVNLTGTGRPVDAVIAPVAPFAAALPEKYGYYGYTTFVNLLDYTSCVIPVTHVDKELDIVDPEYQFLNSQDKSVWESYDPDVYDGTPVAIQVIGRRLQEEKVLALSELLTDALSARGGT